MESLVGKTIGSYQIISEIGRGGMAMVYKAYHPTLERYVALKVLPPQFAFDTDFVKRFLLEARAAARLKHPNIVTIYDVGEQNGLYYIVMELVEGGSLAQLIQREGQLAPARAANIITQVASALDYAHALGFVHRDVKPSNILIGTNDHATLTDFGIVKAAEGTRVTRTGTMIGTPEYMSPEQIRGQPVDGRADIYALGIVCYEMLAGRVPFAGDTARVLYGQVHETPPPLAINSRALRTVEQALAGALAKDPHQRYARASDFSNALNQAARGITSSATTASARQTRSVPRPLRESKSLLWLAAGLGGMGLVFFLLIFLAAKPNRPIENSASSNSMTAPIAVLVTTWTPTATATFTAILTYTSTFTVTPSSTSTQTQILTPTVEPTDTKTFVPTRTSTHLPTPTNTLKPPETQTRTRTTLRQPSSAPMVFVSAGEFTMGANEPESGFISSHTVYLDEFWIDEYEVTNQLYKECVEASNCRRPLYAGSQTRSSYYENSKFGNYPVIGVSWNDALAYCNWAGKRLPTEAEWEKAARGSDNRLFPWGNEWDLSRANGGNNRKDTTEVGIYPSGASPYGAMDMAGNVWEWVADWDNRDYYVNPPRTNPTGPAKGESKVQRGGAFSYFFADLRTTKRIAGTPTSGSSIVGFRCAR